MFSRFIETEKHKNNAWQLQKRLQESSAAIDDKLRQQYKDPEIRQLVRYTVCCMFPYLHLVPTK